MVLRLVYHYWSSLDVSGGWICDSRCVDWGCGVSVGLKGHPSGTLHEAFLVYFGLDLGSKGAYVFDTSFLHLVARPWLSVCLLDFLAVSTLVWVVVLLCADSFVGLWEHVDNRRHKVAGVGLRDGHVLQIGAAIISIAGVSEWGNAYLTPPDKLSPREL